MPIFLSQKEKGSKPYPNVKFRTFFYVNNYYIKDVKNKLLLFLYKKLDNVL